MGQKFPEKLSAPFLAKYEKAVPPWGPVGYVVYKRTYSRLREDLGRTEEWHETVARCVNALLQMGARYTQDEAERLYDHVFHLRGSFSGRALWQLGTATVEKVGFDSLANCWAVALDHPIEPFCFLFNELMLGGGVGFNLQREYVYEIPKVKHEVQITRRDERDVQFIVPDNREGWVELLRRVLLSYFVTGTSWDYSTICIRGRGTPIKSFGGTASGPEDLCKGLEIICGILSGRVGKKLRPIDCLDICNVLGWITVAGNVRRSAQLSLGDYDDQLFLNAKDWSTGTVPNWRALSNNSVVCNRIDDLPPRLWKGYDGSGEPYGFVNLALCRLFGRLCDGRNYRRDPKVIGVNPCSEITLESMECCNLSEVFLPNVKDEAQLHDILGLLYKACKTITGGKFIHPQTQEVVSRNRRLGLSLSGYLQWKHQHDHKILDRAYKRLEKLDTEYSQEIGAPPSIKLTTLQPSGTKSLLAGVFPGAHPGYAPHYVRRVRMASNDPLVGVCREHGYPVEPQVNFDGTLNHDTQVISFPIKGPEPSPTVIYSQDTSAIQQLETVKFLQTWWADNSVSITVYYQKNELPAIQEWLKQNYDDGLKTVSFLLHSDHGFAQAPYEPITKEQYEQMNKFCKPITQATTEQSSQLVDSLECTTGSCPVR